MVRPDCHYPEQGISDMGIILDKAKDVQSQEWYDLSSYLQQGISDMSIILDKARDVQNQE